jgi:hypothetical protein
MMTPGNRPCPVGKAKRPPIVLVPHGIRTLWMAMKPS